MSRRLHAEAADRFFRGKKKINKFKEILAYSNPEMAERTGLQLRKVSSLFGNFDIKATTERQQDLDFVVKFFHLNPNWVYGGSKKMMADTDALTQTELCKIAIDTPDKRKKCIERFLFVRENDEVSNPKIASLGDIAVSTLEKWLSCDGVKHTKYVPMFLKYCSVYGVNPKWLFLGIGRPRVGDLDISDKIQQIQRQPKWYVVNKTLLIINEGWVIDPDGYQIKKAHRARDVAKSYPREVMIINGKKREVYTYEHAIRRCKNKEDAEKALQEELIRIENEGLLAWKAPWSCRVIL